MSTSVVWFRKCLRLDDNPALTQACDDQSTDSILPIFILDPEIVGRNFEKFGTNRLIFLLESLRDLDHSLKPQADNHLLIFMGSPSKVIHSLFQSLGDQCKNLHSDYCSEPHGRQSTSKILGENNEPVRIPCVFHPAAHTLLDIEKTLLSDGFKNPKSMRDISSIFSKIFPADDSGFFQVPAPLPAPQVIKSFPKYFDHKSFQATYQIEILTVSTLTAKFSELGLLNPSNQSNYFKGGETEALSRLDRKVSTQKDFVNTFRKPKSSSTNLSSNSLEPSTTGLSPYLSVGSLSVRRLWKEVEKANRSGSHTSPPESLHGQLLFREMFYLLSRSVDHWDRDESNEMCKNIEWGIYDQKKMEAWDQGMTGFPLIDAMMRQLDTTGWMHHLGRHAVSCFLTRGQLWQHWKHGRDVFERKLLDSDWALNNANWLWLSGVAPFSMPYFRLYNPCPDGKSSLNVDAKTATFIKYWVPELKNFPVKYIYEPQLAPQQMQRDADCIIGQDYPLPIVNRKDAAKENLAKFKSSLSR
jgi:cryptochrome